MAESIAQEVGGLDGLVNNAGVELTSRVTETNLEDWQKVLDVNLTGLFLGTKHMAPLLQAKGGATSAGASVVNISSILGLVGFAEASAYAASKGGVASLTLPAARELASSGIRVMTIAPGIFGTPMMAGLPQEVQDSLGASVPFPARLGNPAEYASLAKHIITNRMLNGEVIRVDGALRMAPK